MTELIECRVERRRLGFGSWSLGYEGGEVETVVVLFAGIGRGVRGVVQEEIVTAASTPDVVAGTRHGR